MPKLKQKSLRLALQAIGIAVFLLILTRIDLSRTIYLLRSADLRFLLAALPLGLVYDAVKSWRWRLILKVQSIDLAFGEAFGIYLSALFLGLLTPGRVGDMSKILYLTRRGHSIGKSAVSIFLDRILDIILLLSSAYVGMLFFSSLLLSNQLSTLTLILPLSLIAILLLLRLKRFTEGLMSRTLSSFIPERFRDVIAVDEFLSDLTKFSIKAIVLMGLVTVFCWLIYFTQVYMLAMSL